MNSFTNSLDLLKLTKQEKQNVKDVAIIRRYKKLMNNAQKCKESYIELKSKDASNLTKDNRDSLKSLIKSEYNDALNYYNAAKELKTNNPDLIK
jgi:hypothetical protein